VKLVSSAVGPANDLHEEGIIISQIVKFVLTANRIAHSTKQKKEGKRSVRCTHCKKKWSRYKVTVSPSSSFNVKLVSSAVGPSN